MPPSKLPELDEEVHGIRVEMSALQSKMRSIIWLFSIGIGTVMTLGISSGMWAYSMHGTVTRLVTNQDRILEQDSAQTKAITDLVRVTDLLSDRFDREE